MTASGAVYEFFFLNTLEIMERRKPSFNRMRRIRFIIVLDKIPMADFLSIFVGMRY